jgi:spermidine synthase
VLSFPWWLSLLVGFLSLSEEILWVRIIGFSYQTLPPAFAFVLACYLVGIAIGAACGKRLCARAGDLYGAAALILGVSALFDVSLPLLIARLVSTDVSNLGGPAVLIAATAALKSTLFPIAHHLGSAAEGPRVGRTMSRIYFGNIIGATLGPLVTGLVALEHLSTDECFAAAGAVCLLMSAACVLKSGRPQLIGASFSAAVASSAIAMHSAMPGPGSLATLALGGPRTSMSHFITNRYGVIHTMRTTVGDMVFGGNVYDGIAAVNVDRNPNRLDRLYLLAMLHPNPQRALVIGLSTGAWVRCLEGFPTIRRIEVVEINPGYLELIKRYPRLAPILTDPRVHIHIDDGRRWLKRNPDERFDLVIQNTTYHWRANAGNLLSREYFAEMRRHLSPGGIVTTNTTGSVDVLATAAAVFAHAYRYANFAYASDRALMPNFVRLGVVRRPDGAPFAIHGTMPAGSVVAFLAHAQLEPVEAFLATRESDGRILTDDNLLTEYRDGRRFGPKLLRALLPAAPRDFGEASGSPTP